MALSVENMCKKQYQEWYIESRHELHVSGMPLASVFYRWMCNFVTHHVFTFIRMIDAVCYL